MVTNLPIQIAKKNRFIYSSYEYILTLNYFCMSWIDDFTKKQKAIVALAPMDGYCDSAFRSICRTVAPEIVVFSEFYSAD